MSSAAFLFAPGAGAPSTSPWMTGWRSRLSTVAPTVTLDYPYMREGRRAPDPLPKLVSAHRDALAALRAERPAAAVFLAGKSMGGRVGCHVALTERVAGLVCLGYPLKGAGKTGSLRDQVLLSLETPILFVQGTRDPLCPLPLLEEVRGRMKAESELYVVQGGNHSLEVDKKTLASTGSTQADSDAGVLAAIAAFVSRVSTARR